MSRQLLRIDEKAAWLIGPAILALTAWAALTLPIPAVGILGGSATVAFVAWLRTGYRRPTRSRAVVAAYLTAVSFQIIHLSEEWNGDFPHEFVDLVGSSRDWSLDGFLTIFVFAAGAIWVLAGAGALYGLRSANYFLWFYALGAGLINAVAHFAFPLFSGGYFPGLITAPGHLLLSAFLIRMLVLEDRRLRHEQAEEPGVAARSGAERELVGAAR